ncbi:hypothetical protein BD289DRAFT_427158 [Coniella lustricola]|uniref:Uncharacterized protein n=1 Tax=Coniella lustricola TaxID=2025994 RepID=A0A2T3AFR9_9PEZI|nr:hypothetical protein BD289DRAFT_427158 [Coniella lustricola]
MSAVMRACLGKLYFSFGLTAGPCRHASSNYFPSATMQVCGCINDDGLYHFRISGETRSIALPASTHPLWALVQFITLDVIREEQNVLAEL